MRMFSILCLTIFSASIVLSQSNNYWSNAPVEGNKIYSICFDEMQNGIAISYRDELFVSLDSGKSWKYSPYKNTFEIKDTAWSGDIYCAIMQTTDGGINWNPYESEMQEHFCNVYFNDQNTGYKIAEEFLYKVTAQVKLSLVEEKISSLINNPQQCTEYYKNEDEGWALGWCLKNFNFYKN